MINEEKIKLAYKINKIAKSKENYSRSRGIFYFLKSDIISELGIPDRVENHKVTYDFEDYSKDTFFRCDYYGEFSFHTEIEKPTDYVELPPNWKSPRQNVCFSAEEKIEISNRIKNLPRKFFATWDSEKDINFEKENAIRIISSDLKD